MLNMAQIIGHLGRDPEVRYTPEGTAIANLATARFAMAVPSGV
jgi:single-strand DNA-binding protein